jgi:hypothetical protein
VYATASSGRGSARMPISTTPDASSWRGARNNKSRTPKRMVIANLRHFLRSVCSKHNLLQLLAGPA